MKRVLPVVVAMVLLMGLRAQDPTANLNGGDPDGQYEPGRAVARISVLNGDVSVRRGDSGDVVAAALNAPLDGGRPVAHQFLRVARKFSWTPPT